MNNGNTAVPRKMNFAAAPPTGQYSEADGVNGEQDMNAQRESLPPMTLPSGAIFTGQWLNGMKDGYGHQRWPDGSKYEGEW